MCFATHPFGLGSPMVITMDPTLLPDYSPSIPAPDYSSIPLPGEHCIQRTPAQTLYDRGSVSFSYQENGMSLMLRGCREEEGAPVFGLCSTIHGEFEPADREKIVSVAVKLEGHIFIKEGTRMSSTLLLSQQRILWETDDAEIVCPGLLPLSVSFPENYWDKVNERFIRLPPSFATTRPWRAGVVYTLSILLRKKRCSLFCLRAARDLSMNIHLQYKPRIRPPRPAPIYFSSLKQCPDEWQEEIWSINSRFLHNGDSLFTAECYFFLPSVRVFSMSESIPFHLAFCGPISCLRREATPEKDDEGELFSGPIHVFLVRQTTMRGKHSKAVQEEILGKGSLIVGDGAILEKMPPHDPVRVSWDGELRCDTPLSCSAFNTPVLEVKDYIVLSLVNSLRPMKAMEADVHYAIPIRLVTHPWIDRS